METPAVVTTPQPSPGATPPTSQIPTPVQPQAATPAGQGWYAISGSAYPYNLDDPEKLPESSQIEPLPHTDYVTVSTVKREAFAIELPKMEDFGSKAVVFRVGRGDDARQFLMNSTKLRKASPVLDKWITTTDLNKRIFVSRIWLDDMNPRAFHILALLLHGMAYKLPNTVSDEVLFDLAKACSKFRTEGCVANWVTHCLEPLLDETVEMGSIQWLHVSWVFKYPALFESHIHHIICTAENKLGPGILGLKEQMPADLYAATAGICARPFTFGSLL